MPRLRCHATVVIVEMNNTASEGVSLVKAIAPLVKDANCEVVACVPAIDIPACHATVVIVVPKGFCHVDRSGDILFLKRRHLDFEAGFLDCARNDKKECSK